MTGYTVHTGTTKKFSEGWDRVFSSGGKSSQRKPAKAKKRTTSRKAGKRKSR